MMVHHRDTGTTTVHHGSLRGIFFCKFKFFAYVRRGMLSAI